VVAVSLGGVKTVMVDASSCARLAVHLSDGWAAYAHGRQWLGSKSEVPLAPENRLLRQPRSALCRP
jgi:hypothetical protein